MNKLLIIGAGGHGKVVADIAMSMDKWDYIAFLDDNKKKVELVDIDIIGKTSDVFDKVNEYEIFVAVGNNELRSKVSEQLKEANAQIATIVHPKSIIGTSVSIGEGTVIMPGVVINCCTSIAKGCIINTGAVIDHDCIIEEYSHISPGAKLAGTVTVGQRSWLGIGSVVSNNVSICGGCIVGAGAVVIRDINKAGTYVGFPAKLK